MTADVIEELREWRRENGLSQRQAVEVMLAGGVPVTLRALGAWEMGYRRPGRMAQELLRQFLGSHGKVDGVAERRYREAARVVSKVEVKEIKALRHGGWTLKKIGERFRISESAVSRICAGNRHGKKAKTLEVA